MLGRVKAILGRLHTGSAGGVGVAWAGGQSSVSDDGLGGERTSDDSATVSSPHLYECSSCHDVYIAIDKRTCSTCDAAVDRIE